MSDITEEHSSKDNNANRINSRWPREHSPEISTIMERNDRLNVMDFIVLTAEPIHLPGGLVVQSLTIEFVEVADYSRCRVAIHHSGHEARPNGPLYLRVTILLSIHSPVNESQA